MLKIKETEDENKLWFQNDFKRLLELSKEDLLAEKTYEFLLDLYQNRYHSDGGFVVVFWNRFTGEIKKSYSSYKNKQLEDIPHNSRDFLSWFPIFATNLSEFFSVLFLKLFIFKLENKTNTIINTIKYSSIFTLYI